MKTAKAYLLLLPMLVLLLSCCEEEEPDPCEALAPVTADFMILEDFYFDYPENWEPYDTDTVRSGRVVFMALEEGARYTWTLGAETIHERSFMRHSFPLNQPIEVSLRVEKEPNTNCFPEDDGLDSLRRDFWYIGRCQAPDFDGEWEGVIDGDTARTIFIETCAEYPDPSPSDDLALRIVNLVEGCDVFNGFEIEYVGFEKIYFKDTGIRNCLNPIGVARLHGPNKDSITIEYEIDAAVGDIDNTIQKTFQGKRR